MPETHEENIERKVAFQTNETKSSSAFECGTNYFLGIGIDDYEYGKKLRNWVRDVKSIRDERWTFTTSKWQIAAFADLYALKVSQSSYPK